MKYYWIKTHTIVRKLFYHYVWHIPTTSKKIYLTFDDGPTPEITEWVLGQLEAYQAKATFFCIGVNIKNNPEIFEKVIAGGHTIGNHTFDHLNGWKVETPGYIENVAACEKEIDSNCNTPKLFRPPYGKLKRSQSAIVRNLGYKVIMWDILSADFDLKVTPEQCLNNVVRNINPGSVVIFHDSLKAFRNLEYALPRTLAHLKEKGYECVPISFNGN